MLIGRVREKTIIEKLFSSSKAEFLGMYGRRRVGKTYLLRQTLQNKPGFYFELTGLKDGSMADQLNNFNEAFRQAFPAATVETAPKNWQEAFTRLDAQITNTNQPVTIFLDELPWLATKRSKLIENIDYFWNRSWSQKPTVFLAVCGSAAAWMFRNVINTKGGLYNRLTQQISLQPFSLSETKSFLQANNFDLTNQQIVELYMVMGGIPYYLDQLPQTTSSWEMVNELCFQPGGRLLLEYKDLFRSLFDNAATHYAIIELLANSRMGVPRKLILDKVSGNATRPLEELELAGFIQRYQPYKSKKKGSYYKILDEYVFFYKRWIEKAQNLTAIPKEYWLKQVDKPSFRSWAGYSFETLCVKHIDELLTALGISGMAVDPYSWRFQPAETSRTGAQIDVILERADRIISIGEIKYSQDPFRADKAFYQKVKERNSLFKYENKIKRPINNFLIAANGVIPNSYSDELFFKTITIDDFF